MKQSVFIQYLDKYEKGFNAGEFEAEQKERNELCKAIQFYTKEKLQKARKGVFITTSSFSKDARGYAEKSGKIALIDGLELVHYMIEYNVGVSTKQVYEVKRIDSDYFEE